MSLSRGSALDLPSGQIFIGNASGVATATPLSGDATLTNGGQLTISNGSITNAKLRSSAGNSVMGKGLSSGSPIDIICTGNDNVLRRAGSGAIGWGTIATGGIANGVVTLPKIQPINPNTLLGRLTSGVGAPEELTFSQVLSVLPNGFKVEGVTHFYQDTTPTANANFDRWYRPGSGTAFIWRANVIQPAGGTAGHWVTERIYTLNFEGSNQSTATSVGRKAFMYMGLDIPVNIYLERGVISCQIASGGNPTDASNFWALNLDKYLADGSSSSLHTLNLNNGLSTASKVYNFAPNKLIDESNLTQLLQCRSAKTGTIANLSFGIEYQYRLIQV